MTYAQLYKESKREIARGGIYSHRWGDASLYLRTICYEMIKRKFSWQYQAWAHYVVNRESGCNPAAVNTTYGSWTEQAKGIAQIIPKYHTWIDYKLYMSDMKYAVAVFLRLSRNGHNQSPWYL